MRSQRGWASSSTSRRRRLLAVAAALSLTAYAGACAAVLLRGVR